MSELKGRGAAWTEESDEGTRCLKGAPEASGEHRMSEPQGPARRQAGGTS